MPVIRILAAGVAVVALSACASEVTEPVIPVAGDPETGRATIIAHGCGSCHTIPGVPEADALVGPPLTAWSERAYIAGLLPNSPDNLATFLEDPDAVSPGTAMPDLRLTEEDISAIVAYLFTLE